MHKQREYLEPCLSEIQAELTMLTTALNAIKSDVDSLKTAVGSNCSKLNKHDRALQDIDLKLADMEDRNRRCNINVIGLDKGVEGSNATHFISQSLPKWYPD